MDWSVEALDQAAFRNQSVLKFAKRSGETRCLGFLVTVEERHAALVEEEGRELDEDAQYC